MNWATDYRFYGIQFCRFVNFLLDFAVKALIVYSLYLLCFFYAFKFIPYFRGIDSSSDFAVKVPSASSPKAKLFLLNFREMFTLGGVTLSLIFLKKDI